jgi:F-type H+-transporting ATPase subunit a
MIATLLASSDPLEHVVDYAWFTSGKFTLLSNHIIMMLLAAIILIVLMPRLLRVPTEADDVARHTPRGARNGIEALCTFFREFVARPNLGPYTDRFVGYIWTLFFFIFTCNLLGLLPLAPITKFLFRLPHGVSGAATGNVWVTGALAVCTLLMVVGNGLWTHGFGYVRHFFMGPFPINILIAVLDVVGLFAKSFALAVRLFANMVAGHILLGVLLSFIAMAFSAGAVIGFSIAIPVVAGSVAITMLELFVAFLQAFIFTFLTAVFIGMAVNIHSEHQEGHAESGEHGADHGHAQESHH